jgi:rhomboid protease GluP
VVVAVHVATGVGGLRHGLDPLRAFVLPRGVTQRIAAGGQYATLVGKEPWRLVTCTLLHVDALHLTLNALALLALGRALDRHLGRLRVVAGFCGSAVAGALTSHLAGVHQSDGASGGVFGLLAAGSVIGLRGALDEDDRWLLGRVFPVFLVLNAAISLVVPAIDPFAHLGGAVAGALWALLPDRPSTRAAEALLVGLYVGACVFGWSRP